MHKYDSKSMIFFFPPASLSELLLITRSEYFMDTFMNKVSCKHEVKHSRQAYSTVDAFSF